MSRLEEKYKAVADSIKEKIQCKNVHQIPKLEKVIVNVGAGEAIQNNKVLAAIEQDLAQITGQKPIITKAKKSIAGFKLREGMPIGVKVTLRKEKMYHFLDRLLSIALPRVRDFKGVSPRSFDGKGNYSLGLKEQILFPEVSYDKVDKLRGMSITVVTTAKTNEEAKVLLDELGFPFRK